MKDEWSGLSCAQQTISERARKTSWCLRYTDTLTEQAFLRSAYNSSFPSPNKNIHTKIFATFPPPNSELSLHLAILTISEFAILKNVISHNSDFLALKCKVQTWVVYKVVILGFILELRKFTSCRNSFKQEITKQESL